ncbi:MAG: sugar ABC transporter permease [Lachnospiraceae bacterium]|jgi:ABC-type sugar transport system permease subunit|nr:sugar ABC transporter permease [Lachnospiraceae bacterium]MCI1398282.1 sugar ABC transporter permease [Lachnospiraceae bacterium]MCI1424538.1 sugar ABC transporter permease [Lachnospiraceae bacterium]
MNSATKRKIRRELGDFVFVLPAIIVFILVIIIPMIAGIRYSFTDWNGMSKQMNFVGLKNYNTIIHDKDLIKPICNTALYTVVTTVVINILGLVFAMMVVNEFRSVNVIKSIIFVPLVVSLVLVSYMWMYVYSDFFSLFGLESPLIKEKTVMIGLCAMAIWKETGLAMMIYLAALKGVPSDYYEAATIDGAGFWAKFKNITIPMIAPAFTYCIPYWIAGGLRMYDYSYVATNGGPNHASESMAYYIYEYLFPYNKVGYGQAVAVIYLIVCLVLSQIVTRSLRKREIEL